MLRSHSNPYVSKNKVVLVVASVLVFTLIDWVTEPGEVSSIEGAALDGITAELAARAQAVEKTLAQLVRELGEIDDGDEPLTALGGVKARFEEQRSKVERVVDEAEETLHGMLEANHKQLEEWVASLPDGCQDGGGAAAKKRPMPDHPLGGQDEVIEVDIPNVKDDGVANAMRAKEEEDRYDTTLGCPRVSFSPWVCQACLPLLTAAPAWVTRMSARRVNAKQWWPSSSTRGRRTRSTRGGTTR